MGFVEPGAFRRRARRKTGFSLLLVIWALGLVGVLVLSFTFSARLRLAASANVVEAAAAEALAEAGVTLAISALEDGASPNATSRFSHDGRPVFCSMPTGAVAAIALEDEAGKIDINSMPQPALEKIFTALGAASEVASRLSAAIVSYRSARTNALSDEERAYAAAGRPFGPRKGLFQTIFEVDQVVGFSKETKRFLPFLTVHSFAPEPDLSVAPPAVFAAWTGAKGGDIAELIAHPYPNTLDRRAYPKRTAPASAVLIHAEIRTAKGAMFAREALVAAQGEATNGAYAVKEWRQGDFRYRADLQAAIDQRRALPPC